MIERISPTNPDTALLRRLQQIESTSPEPGRQPRRLIYPIEITEECGLVCPVCYMAATSGHGRHQPLERILSLGARVVGDGGRFVQLIGGEPAEHPCLLEIVRGILTVDGDMRAATRGEERVRRCPACFVTDQGPVSACARICSPHSGAGPVEVAP